MKKASLLSDLADASAAVARETERRNRLIVAARKSGASWASIQTATTLSRAGVNKIARLTNGNLPVPRA